MKSDSQSVSFDPGVIASSSYEECVERLAHAVDSHDDAELEEVACLIGQLAVVIEQGALEHVRSMRAGLTDPHGAGAD